MKSDFGKANNPLVQSFGGVVHILWVIAQNTDRVVAAKEIGLDLLAHGFPEIDLEQGQGHIVLATGKAVTIF